MASTTLLIVASVLMGVGSAHGQPAKKPAEKPPAKQPSEAPPKPTKPPLVATNDLGFAVQKGTEQGLTVAEEKRGWSIRDGETKVQPGVPAGLDPKLQINRFTPADDSVVVQLNASPKDRDLAFLNALEAADKTKPAVLVDGKGRKYEPVGFVYRDPELIHIRFTKSATLHSLRESPSVSRSTPQRQLTLVFCVNLGAEIKEFRIGDNVIETYDPPIKCDKQQK